MIFEEKMSRLVFFILLPAAYLFTVGKHRRTFFAIIILLKLELCLRAFGFFMITFIKFSKVKNAFEYLNNLIINQSVLFLTFYRNIMTIKEYLFLINRLIINSILSQVYSKHFYNYLYQNAFLPIIPKNSNFIQKC